MSAPVVVTRSQPLLLTVTNEKREQEWQVYVTVDDNGEPRVRVSWLGPIKGDDP